MGKGQFEVGDNVLTSVNEAVADYFNSKDNRQKNYGIIIDIVHPDTWRLPMIRYIVVDHGNGIIANYHTEEIELL